MYTFYKALLKEYADSLIKSQIHNQQSAFNGGFFCECCKNVHGRSIDALYALSVCYKLFKSKKYLDAIRGLLTYSLNLICDDGGIYNDLQTQWRFTTTFHEIALVETLNSCKDTLPNDIILLLEERIKIHARWLYENLDENSKANINYCTTNALALLLAGEYLSFDTYTKQAYHLVNYALKHISKNNLFYGECQPHDFRSDKGCYGIDIGYNLEESLPALAKFAYLSKDKEIMSSVYQLAKGHLPFILPDGAIDNSFGDRNYKWTYYGSRTCDGILPLCFILGEKDKLFIEAANRNVSLMKRCSPYGLLQGGVDYHKNDEKPCLHHTFEHINSLAFVVDHFKRKLFKRVNLSLPCEHKGIYYLEEFDSYRLINDKYIFCVSNYDVNIPYSGHLSGGSVTLLFSKETSKPLIVGSVGDYQLTESTNMQVTLKTKTHSPLHPRIEKIIDKEYFSSGYFLHSQITQNGYQLSCNGGLATRYGKHLEDKYYYQYHLKDDGLYIKITSDKPFCYILPLINGNLNIVKGTKLKSEQTFFLTPGFMATTYIVQSQSNEIEVVVK